MINIYFNPGREKPEILKLNYVFSIKLKMLCKVFQFDVTNEKGISGLSSNIRQTRSFVASKPPTLISCSKKRCDFYFVICIILLDTLSNKFAKQFIRKSTSNEYRV